MSVINTNYLAMVSQNNLTKSQNALGTAIERLSSGLRINSAKDDAAGQAIANRFTANINGLQQASRNANDGISVAQTTEGALNEINNNLQRIRVLSVQAANGSNSQSDLDSIQAEIDQRLGEINRVSEQTQFNSVRVLAGDRDSLTIQVGSQDNETISISLSKIDSNTLGLGTFSISKPTLDESTVSASPVTEVQAGTTVSVPLRASDTNTAGGTAAVYVDDADAETLYVSTDGGTTFHAATYNNTTGELEYDSSATVAATATAAAPGAILAVGGGVSVDDVGFEDTNPAADPELFVGVDGEYYVSFDGGSTTRMATGFDPDTGVVEYDSSVAATTAPTGLSSAVTTYESLEDPVTANLSAVTAELGSSAALHSLTGGGYVVKATVDGNETYFKANVAEDGTVTLAQDADGENIEYTTELNPLAALDNALQIVDSLRSDLGAVQNRFQSTIANLSNTVNNLSAARSRIEDADYAVEVSNMTRAQILQQAGTSVLAQANQVPQTVLSLLR